MIDLIETAEVTEFLVGNQGAFDYAAIKVLSELKKQYVNICCTIVYAYMPAKQPIGGFESVYPEDAAKAVPKFAIDCRNRWLVEKSDIVIAYVKSPAGGAAKFKALAERKGKKVINLAENE